MKTTPSLCFLLSLYGANAWEVASVNDSRLLNWRAPGLADSRSPCPGLNSLANHGFLPHDGRNISIIQTCKAIWEGLGATPDIAAAVLAFAFFPWPLENLKDFRFDLEQLSTHMMFNEHDVSYSRNDAFLGDNARFNQTVWDQSLKELKPEMLTPTDFAKARQARAEDTFARNTNTTFSFFDMALSSTETSFFFTVFGSGRKTSKSMIRYFIENERLPVALGWLPRLNTNAASVALLIPEVLLGMPKIWAKLGSQTLDVLNLKTFLTLINQRIATGDMLGYLDSFKSVLDDENTDSSSVSRLADLIKSAA